jgi:hypothetical protein
VTLSPSEQMASVDRQIRANMRGVLDVIVCPYCGIANFQTDKALCCAWLGAAVTAVLQRLEVEDRRAHFEKVMEAASKN